MKWAANGAAQASDARRAVPFGLRVLGGEPGRHQEHRPAAGPQVGHSVAERAFLDLRHPTTVGLGCRSVRPDQTARAGTPKRPDRDAIGRFGLRVARGGVEPPTYRFSVGRSYQLSYLAKRVECYMSVRRSRNRPGRRTWPPRGALDLIHGQLDPERGAAAEGRFGADRAAVALRDGAGQREPEPGALDRAPGVADEGLEDVRELLGHEAGPVVAHDHAQTGFAGLAVQ